MSEALNQEENDIENKEAALLLEDIMKFSTTHFSDSELRLQHPLFKKLVAGKWNAKHFQERPAPSYVSLLSHSFQAILPIALPTLQNLAVPNPLRNP